MRATELLRVTAGILLTSLLRPRRARVLWTLLVTNCECCARRVLELLYVASVASLLAAIIVTAYAPAPWPAAVVAAVVLLTGLGLAALWAQTVCIGEEG
jgi:hypothetical protein